MRSAIATKIQAMVDLETEMLEPRSIDTLLIAGAVTNICESSARDAVELGYKVIMVSDALSGHTHGLHEASLATLYRIFGDVRRSNEIRASRAIREWPCRTLALFNGAQSIQCAADSRMTTTMTRELHERVHQ